MFGLSSTHIKAFIVSYVLGRPAPFGAGRGHHPGQGSTGRVQNSPFGYVLFVFWEQNDFKMKSLQTNYKQSITNIVIFINDREKNLNNKVYACRVCMGYSGHNSYSLWQRI